MGNDVRFTSSLNNVFDVHKYFQCILGTIRSLTLNSLQTNTMLKTIGRVYVFGGYRSCRCMFCGQFETSPTKS